jgi:AraC-like DNA-binding protein/mannose-6-phosphate isomerase-like protein (cupin superfamily)
MNSLRSVVVEEMARDHGAVDFYGVTRSSMTHALKSATEVPDDDVSVYRVDLSDQRAMETHAHAHGQLFSLESGLSILETSAGSWLLPPRRCGWIPAGHPHSVRSGGLVRGWLLFLSAPLCKALPKRPLVLSLSPLLEHLVLRIASWEKTPPPEHPRKRLLEVLVDEIQMAQEQPLHLPMPADPRLQQLVGEMARDLETDRSLDEWARWLGMSERSLQRDFQREVGTTIGQWRQQLRILVALGKLTEGLSVTDTCFAVGYNNVSAFIKAFKRIVGLTPLEYVKNQKNNPKGGNWGTSMTSKSQQKTERSPDIHLRERRPGSLHQTA